MKAGKLPLPLRTPNPDQAYGTKELADIFRVSPKVFLKWIKPFKRRIGKRRGRYYTVRQVMIIYNLLGGVDTETDE
ncbi:MAG: hypothetical protein H7Y86_21685 [Rhizobacter sp.]|nr:hypothetical protein [Ferruginibacter sp.]